MNQDNNLDKHIETSKVIDQIAIALSRAQGELESVPKDEMGYGYSYSSLADTIRLAKPVLAKYELAISQLVSNKENRPAVITILMHSSGQFIRSEASLPLIEMKGCNEAQRAGAVYSYLRRYALQAILNMSSEDNDAASEVNVNKPKTKTAAPTEKERELNKLRAMVKDVGANRAMQILCINDLAEIKGYNLNEIIDAQIVLQEYNDNKSE